MVVMRCNNGTPNLFHIDALYTYITPHVTPLAPLFALPSVLLKITPNGLPNAPQKFGFTPLRSFHKITKKKKTKKLGIDKNIYHIYMKSTK